MYATKQGGPYTSFCFKIYTNVVLFRNNNNIAMVLYFTGLFMWLPRLALNNACSQRSFPKIFLLFKINNSLVYSP